MQDAWRGKLGLTRFWFRSSVTALRDVSRFQGQRAAGANVVTFAPLVQYAADPQDKHWLAEQQHMRATGGKMVSGTGNKTGLAEGQKDLSTESPLHHDAQRVSLKGELSV